MEPVRIEELDDMEPVRIEPVAIEPLDMLPDRTEAL